ncbi:3-hydroxyacyl-CoA dehydrogenase family protein [Leptospira santarosai]|uniref:3-hydroxyacyl-CoA dehydrogenase n=2 Tax=Leptospira santarosai TaxID=28183 RepID=K8Y312_9LEPT|nr:3-hydroxyacyl-CoA dehydrogenase family protein [Leptospira santarosai]EKT87864.1 3-hydroxyacyl-CoA dehydrogenase [Leptospira santarosai serovar Shermani str. LT 821]EMM75304.1 3-hydroxyacyl-CoA dehydrogenase, NAD binding domain protein [Leptospira santarosai str. 2000030832]EPG80944.1 3-hydroxyacyl-CoA dehydrogenase, NAD binding domain protein [Leptospira santarosai serovar Shermani str. 1342KT]MDI7188764.1 3-hydroxyacyl-CoA dehydrogenase family protein [Leptospira santarosai]MDI7195933.1 3
MREIKTVTVLGANGTMGAGSAAIVASFGKAKVHMLARDASKAKEGIEKAIASVKTDTIRPRLIPGSYDADLERAVSESDWVFELVAESYEVKEPINKRIASARKPGTIVSTVSSGLSIERLSKVFDSDGQKHYFGTHFFNPPYKMILCELVSHKGSDKKVLKQLGEYLEKVLGRAVVYTNDTPAFAGNRIGFQLINEVAQIAEKYSDKGGIALMDAIMSGYTGRAMAPLDTADFVGLDVHKAIVDNLYEMTKDAAHSTFKMPSYFQKLIDKGDLGRKAGGGLYKMSKTPDGKKEKLVYNIGADLYEPVPKFDIDFIRQANKKISEADYTGAMNIVKEAKGFEADLARYFIARYVSYSLSIVGEVVDTKEMADLAMGTGFNWAPASAFVDFLGGPKDAIQLIEKAKLPVPEVLAKAKLGKPFYELKEKLDARSLFKG